MERRKFITSSCLACAGVAFGGLLASALSGCHPLPVFKYEGTDADVRVSKQQFPEGQKLLIVRHPKLDFDVLLVKKNAEEYTALYMQCTHENQPLNATQSGLHCASHGSSFDLDGNVLVQPANKPLRKFALEYTAEDIIIHINKAA